MFKWRIFPFIVKQYAADDILDGIRNRKDEILQYVYRENYPAVKSFVLENKGDIQDAKDVFQEGIVLIFKKVTSGELTLNCSFRTYLFSICRLVWFRELEKRKYEKMDQKDLKGYMDLQLDLNFNEIEQDKYRLYQKHLDFLEPDCRKILTLFYDGVPVRDITRVMGFTSESYTKKRKFQCKEKLVSSIMNDPKYKSLKG